MFRDECEIEVFAGKGGDGAISFHREKYVPKGGPDGGDGGKGGDVVLVATSRINSLLALGRRPRYAAKNGQPGGPRNRFGHGGADLVVEVPIGTQVFDAERGHLLSDLDVDERRLILAAGGRGGRGNASFKSSVRQTPRRFEHGRPGESRRVRLELKLFAEVGLVGLPNAGKSTFLSVVSRARPKIADYPFTTLVPQVGIAEVGDYDTLVFADLPGLIEGAADGAGLGHRFLKHVERCRVLLHLVDVSAEANTDPTEALAVLERELERYSPELYQRPRLLAATKVEDEAAEQRAAELEQAAGRKLFRLSSLLGEGLAPLLEQLRRTVRDAPDAG
ncbi:MAG: GTPase ObgE [Planctomycetota bacterium]